MCTVKHNADIGPAGKFNDHLVKTFYFDRWEARESGGFRKKGRGWVR